MSLIVTSRSIARLASMLTKSSGSISAIMCLTDHQKAPCPGIMSRLMIDVSANQIDLTLRCEGTLNSISLPQASLEVQLIKICEWIEACANTEVNQGVTHAA